jgi:hypothetical protein
MGGRVRSWDTKDLVPPLALDVLRVMRQGLRYPSRRGLLSANREWQGRYRHQTVYVLANGPSVAIIDRHLLKLHRVIVMNNFHRAEWKDEFRPVAHCIGEPPESPAWVDPSDSINATNSESYWLNIAALGHVGEVKSTKRLHYVMAGVEPRLWGERAVPLHGLALGFQTTAILAIEVALYMGFTDIRLVGFDHDWLASPDYSRHFYAEEPDPEDKLGTLSYLEVLRFVTRMWEGYYALKRAARSHGATIVNLTAGSYLDVFEHRVFPG